MWKKKNYTLKKISKIIENNFEMLDIIDKQKKKKMKLIQLMVTHPYHLTFQHTHAAEYRELLKTRKKWN